MSNMYEVAIPLVSGGEEAQDFQAHTLPHLVLLQWRVRAPGQPLLSCEVTPVDTELLRPGDTLVSRRGTKAGE